LSLPCAFLKIEETQRCF
jgi:hypothetical protein